MEGSFVHQILKNATAPLNNTVPTSEPELVEISHTRGRTKSNGNYIESGKEYLKFVKANPGTKVKIGNSTFYCATDKKCYVIDPPGKEQEVSPAKFKKEIQKALIKKFGDDDSEKNPKYSGYPYAIIIALSKSNLVLKDKTIVIATLVGKARDERDTKKSKRAEKVVTKEIIDEMNPKPIEKAAPQITDTVNVDAKKNLEEALQAALAAHKDAKSDEKDAKLDELKRKINEVKEELGEDNEVLKEAQAAVIKADAPPTAPKNDQTTTTSATQDELSRLFIGLKDLKEPDKARLKDYLSDDELKEDEKAELKKLGFSEKVIALLADGKITKEEAKELEISDELFIVIDNLMDAVKRNGSGDIDLAELLKAVAVIKEYAETLKHKGFDFALAVKAYQNSKSFRNVNLKEFGAGRKKIESQLAKIDWNLTDKTKLAQQICDKLQLHASLKKLIKAKIEKGELESAKDIAGFLLCSAMASLTELYATLGITQESLKGMEKYSPKNVTEKNLLAWLEKGKVEEIEEGEEEIKKGDKKKADEIFNTKVLPLIQRGNSSDNPALKTHLREVLKLNPGHTNAAKILAEILNKDKDMKGAEEVIRAAYKVDSQNKELEKMLEAYEGTFVQANIHLEEAYGLIGLTETDSTLKHLAIKSNAIKGTDKQEKVVEALKTAFSEYAKAIENLKSEAEIKETRSKLISCYFILGILDTDQVQKELAKIVGALEAKLGKNVDTDFKAHCTSELILWLSLQIEQKTKFAEEKITSDPIKKQWQAENTEALAKARKYLKAALTYNKKQTAEKTSALQNAPSEKTPALVSEYKKLEAKKQEYSAYEQQLKSLESSNEGIFTVIAKNGTVIRKAPDKKGTRIKIFRTNEAGQKLTWNERKYSANGEVEWYQVTTEDGKTTGWVEADLVEKETFAMKINRGIFEIRKLIASGKWSDAEEKFNILKREFPDKNIPELKELYATIEAAIKKRDLSKIGGISYSGKKTIDRVKRSYKKRRKASTAKFTPGNYKTKNRAWVMKDKNPNSKGRRLEPNTTVKIIKVEDEWGKLANDAGWIHKSFLKKA